MKLPKELQQKKRGKKNSQILKDKVEFSKLISKINKKCRFKGCLFPDKSSCSVPSSIKAHSIQKNKILKSISSSGEVQCFDVRKSFFDNDFGLVGIGDASTFFGFCSNHDNWVFSDIEDKDYINSKKQNFLFAYRACAFEYAMCKYSVCHSKEMANLAENDVQKMFYNSKNIKDKTDLDDMKKKLDRFSREFIKSDKDRDYDIIHSKRIKIDGASLLAVNSVFSLYYDFDGNQIYDPYDYSIELPSIFLNVFPQGDKTNIIFSCFSDQLKNYEKTFDQLVKLNKSLLEDIISQIIVVHCGNLFVSPNRWSKISKKKRDSFISRYMGTMGPIPEKLYLTSPPALNLFREFR